VRRTASRVFRVLPIVAAVALLGPAVAFGQEATSSEAPAAAPGSEAAPPSAEAMPAAGEATVASYTDDQAKRGKSLYEDNCSGCHGTTLGGGGEVPALAGKGFREHWFVGSIGPFMTYISTNMPQQDPGSLDPQTYADIGAYLMSRNHVPAGETEVPADKATWANVTLPPLE
jgi:mono/diheme cytochrome c family protein